MKRVLFVVQHLTVGGSQTSLVSALNAIDYSKCSVTLYSRGKEKDLLSQINTHVKIIVNEDKTRYYLLPYSLLLLAILRIKKLLGRNTKSTEKRLNEYVRGKRIEIEQKKHFKKSEYDVAIAYMQGYTAEFVDKAVKAKKKIVFFHGSIDEKHEIHEKVFDDFDLIVGVSDIVSSFLKETYPNTAQKVVTLENYVDAESLRNKAKEYSVEKSQRFTICTCGRLATDKCFDRAVIAAKTVQDRGYDFCWYFVGDGPQKQELIKMVEYNCLKNRIIFTGAKRNPFPYYLASDVFVLCSDDEALPMTLIESKILCLPVISTKTAGGYALVQDHENGLLVDFSPNAVAEAIIFCIDHPMVLQSYSKNLYAIDYINALQSYQKKMMEIILK